MRGITKRKPGGEQRRIEFFWITDAYPPVVEGGTVTTARGEQLLSVRIVDDAMREAPAVLAGDRYRVVRKAVQVVGGAVERIDDPAEFAAAFYSAGLFGENMTGVSLEQILDDKCLGFTVDLANVVVLRFYFDAQLR